MSFSDLPDEIIEKIVEHCDDDTFKSFCFTCKRNLVFLKDPKNIFRLAKNKIRKEIDDLDLTEEFRPLREEIISLDQIHSINLFLYGISVKGFKHTFQCFDYMKDQRTKYSKRLESEDWGLWNMHKWGLIFFLIFAFIGLAALMLSFVCLGQANDAYDKYTEGKMKTLSTSPLIVPLAQESQSTSPLIVPLTQESQDTAVLNEDLFVETLFLKKRKERTFRENENDGVSVAEDADVFFLWRFTTAAVLQLIFWPFFWAAWGAMNCGSPGLFGRPPSDKVDLDGNWSFKSNIEWCCGWFLLLIVPFVLVPALRMDGFTTTSYWFHFIPYLLLIALIGAVGFCGGVSDEESEQIRPALFIALIFAEIFMFAGLTLCILRLDGVLSSSFLYTYIFLFPTVAFALYLILIFFHDSDFSRLRPFPAVIALVVYGGFVLPFCLRKDGIFHTSYHFTLIPWYLLTAAICVLMVPLTQYKWRDLREVVELRRNQHATRVREFVRLYAGGKMLRKLRCVLKGELPMECMGEW